MTDITHILAKCDHTLLKPDATWEEVRQLCDEGVSYGVASVCIAPCFVAQASDYLDGRLPVCTVVGFPNGANNSAVKRFETVEAIGDGADEIDMVANLGWIKAGQYNQVLEEIAQVRKICGPRVLKVIIETCLLSEEEKLRMCRVVSDSGADYIKTSTGFSTGGATPADVALLKANIQPHLKIKAAGGIATLADAENFLSLGADRLGSSRLVRLAKEWKEAETDADPA